jgi:hypothetical protein
MDVTDGRIRVRLLPIGRIQTASPISHGD